MVAAGKEPQCDTFIVQASGLWTSAALGRCVPHGAAVCSWCFSCLLGLLFFLLAERAQQHRATAPILVFIEKRSQNPSCVYCVG